MSDDEFGQHLEDGEEVVQGKCAASNSASVFVTLLL
jgi:hypothetical protein